MNMLASLTTDASIAPEQDRLGGGIQVLDSGIYLFKVELAYLTQSDSGAMALNLRLKADTGAELRQQLWMTSGKAKGCLNYYLDKDGKKQYLPGFQLANNLCLLTVAKEINQLATEQKMVKLWNKEAKTEVPTPVPMIMDLIGQEVYGAVEKVIVDKTKKEGNEYVATGETREENELVKLFRVADKMTVAEILGHATEPVFFDQWKEKNTGKVRDKSGKAPKASGGAPGLPGAPAGGKPAGSLFGAPAAVAGQPASPLFGARP